VALHQLIDYHRTIWHERRRGDEHLDLGLASLATGLSYHYRRGLLSGLDFAAQVSLQTSSVGLQWNVVNGQRWAVGLSGKALMPLFEWDDGPSYAGGVLVPISYDLLPVATLVVTPAYYHKPWAGDHYASSALHTGLVFGSKRALAVEWSLYQRRYEQGQHESSEQVKVAVVTNLDQLQRPNQVPPSEMLTSFRPTLGYEFSQQMQLGIVARLAPAWFLPEEPWAAASMPVRQETQNGALVYPRSRYVGMRASSASGVHTGLCVSYGFAYRSLLAEVSTADGYRSLSVGVPVLSVGARWQLEQLVVRFAEVYLPLPQIGARIRGIVHREDDVQMRAIRDRYRSWPS
jgi:hypothetical protein